MLKWVEWVNRIYLKQGKVMVIFIKNKNMKSENGILVTWTHFLMNSSWVSCNISPSAQQFKWHWMNHRWWLKNQSAETKTSLLSSPSYLHIPPSIYSSTSLILKLSRSSPQTLIWDPQFFLWILTILLIIRISTCCFGKLLDFFNTAHTNLLNWLGMLCLSASDHVWIEVSHVMISQNEFIYKVFQHYEYYEVQSADISCWILYYHFFNIHSALFYTYLPCWLKVTNKTLIRT